MFDIRCVPSAARGTWADPIVVGLPCQVEPKRAKAPSETCLGKGAEVFPLSHIDERAFDDVVDGAGANPFEGPRYTASYRAEHVERQIAQLVVSKDLAQDLVGTAEVTFSLRIARDIQSLCKKRIAHCRRLAVFDKLHAVQEDAC